ncbi:hypothetical protein HYX00_04240 [Candidatus Woesearchaeota archaeon]|nr:hypothetical protein [Candidatus Woesearchaeota archaeon]
MESKEVKVNCNFCGKEIPSPEDMVEQKHACYDCFLGLKEGISDEEIEKIHVAIPTEKAMQAMPDMVMSYAMEEIFPKLWKDKKEEFKEMSKKELAEISFLAGIQIALKTIKDIEKENAQTKK